MRDKIRILFLSAAPLDKGFLRLQHEVREISDRLQERTLREIFDVVPQLALRTADLQRILVKYQPHIVHFSGHGSMTEEVILEDDLPENNAISWEAITQLFKIVKDNVRVVFLDACFSMSQATPLSKFIDYTVGTNKAVGDEAAKVFASAFYQALAFDRTVPEAFELAKANLSVRGTPGGIAPVLLVRKGTDWERPFLSLSGGADEEEAERLGKAILRLTSGPAHASRAEIFDGDIAEKDVTRDGATEDIRSAGTQETSGSAAVSEERGPVDREIPGVKEFEQRKGAQETVPEINVQSSPISEEERSLVRRELLSGRVIFEQREGIQTVRDVKAALSQLGTSRPVRVGVNEPTYRRILDELYPSPRGLPPPPPPGLIFVGREDSLIDVKKLLGVGQEVRRTGSVTVLRGWPGVGKTTLVGILARDPEVAAAFPDGVLWTALEQNPELVSKIAQWGRALGSDDLLRSATVDDATQRLELLLHDKRMLLIVDGIWDAAHALPFLRAAANNRCALLATTRLTSVADTLANFDTSRSPDESVYVLPVLTEEDALILLRYLAPAAVEENLEGCKELVAELECLPLALHVAGRLLKAEAKLGLDVVDLISDIRERARLLTESDPLDRAEQAASLTVGGLLRRSTDQLDELTRDCFAFLGAFAPTPATFDVRAMKAVWMIDDPQPIIRKLVGSGLLEPVGDNRFQMHALLVQHARSLLS